MTLEDQDAQQVVVGGQQVGTLSSLWCESNASEVELAKAAEAKPRDLSKRPTKRSTRLDLAGLFLGEYLWK